MRWRWSSVAVLAMAMLGRVEGASFEGLGHLPGGGSFSVARAVSADGSVIVGVSDSTDGMQAFRWMPGKGMGALGDLPGGLFFSDAFGVSSDGRVVVGESYSEPGREAFRWTESAGMEGLGDLPGKTFSSRATGVSADGSVIVGTGNYSAGGGPYPVEGEAFRWTAQGMVGLGDVPGGTGVSRAIGISADGKVIVGKGDSGSSFQVEDLGVAMRWTAAEGMVRMGYLPTGDGFSAAMAASSDGSVIVGASRVSPQRTQAFRWTAEEGMVGLGNLRDGRADVQSIAQAVSADGSVIVGMSFSEDGEKAFIWDRVHGMRLLQEVLAEEYGLDLGGWRLTSAMGISADGRVIVGTAYGLHFQQEAWRVVIPEPSGIALIAVTVSVGAMVGRRWRRGA